MVRTKLPNKPAGPAVRTAWLELSERDGAKGSRVEIDSFPFTIGRDAGSDLQLERTEISRNHAVIVYEQDVCRVRDLDSTNGTFVNGKRIQESPLGNGDNLTISATEMTFHLDRGRHTEPATRVLACEETTAPRRVESVRLVNFVRRLQAAPILGGGGNVFQPIVAFRDGAAWGYESLVTRPARSEPADDERLATTSGCSPNLRGRRLHRLIATEILRKRFSDRCLFMALTMQEVSHESELLSEMRHLGFLAPHSARLVLGLPTWAITMEPRIADVCQSLRSLGVRLAFADVCGTRGLSRFHSTVDFFRVSPSLIRGIDHATKQQSRVQAIVEAALAQGTHIIAAGVETDEQAVTCMELGCHFAQAAPLNHP